MRECLSTELMLNGWFFVARSGSLAERLILRGIKHLRSHVRYCATPRDALSSHPAARATASLLFIAVESHPVDSPISHIGCMKPQRLSLGILISVESSTRRPRTILEVLLINAQNAHNRWPRSIRGEGDHGIT